MKLSQDCLRSVCSSGLSHFNVVGGARSKNHLNIFEAIFIARLKPESCLEKEFVRSLSALRYRCNVRFC